MVEKQLYTTPSSTLSDPDVEHGSNGATNKNAPPATPGDQSDTSSFLNEKDAAYAQFIDVDANVHVINHFVDKVGFGRYQWQLWVLCGCGWITDQMLVNPFPSPTASSLWCLFSFCFPFFWFLTFLFSVISITHHSSCMSNSFFLFLLLLLWPFPLASFNPLG